MAEHETIIASVLQEKATQYLRLVIEKGEAYVVSDTVVRDSVAKTVRDQACQRCENLGDGCSGIEELDAEGFLLSERRRLIPPSRPVRCRVLRFGFSLPKTDSTL